MFSIASGLACALDMFSEPDIRLLELWFFCSSDHLEKVSLGVVGFFGRFASSLHWNRVTLLTRTTRRCGRISKLYCSRFFLKFQSSVAAVSPMKTQSAPPPACVSDGDCFPWVSDEPVKGVLVRAFFLSLRMFALFCDMGVHSLGDGSRVRIWCVEQFCSFQGPWCSLSVTSGFV